MLKPFIFIVVMVTFLTIGYRFDFFFTNPPPIVSKDITMETPNIKVTMAKTTQSNKEESSLSKIRSDNNLSNEIKALLHQADKLLQKSKDDEAMMTYNLIIKRIGNSNEDELLKHFATAWMRKAFLYQIYPNIDQDAAIEAYTTIIEKFEKSDTLNFLKLYMNAKIELSRLLPLDERLEIYDELVKRFENHIDSGMQKEIESLLIAKSFELMGKNDEEAMQMLDKVIEQYQENDTSINLPENVRFSILNNIELGIITNNENEQYIELAEKYMSNSADTKPLIDMLNIIKNAQDLNQDEALNQWKKEHDSYNFPDWSFQELERWAYSIEDQESKTRVTQYLNSFVNHKYSTKQIENSSTSNNNTPIPPLDTNQELIPYEEDPYAKEIYEATGEYPNPYE